LRLRRTRARDEGFSLGSSRSLGSRPPHGSVGREHSTCLLGFVLGKLLRVRGPTALTLAPGLPQTLHPPSNPLANKDTGDTRDEQREQADSDR
jgi:hypothetical protein